MSAKDKPGATALSRAAGGGHQAVVEALLAQGANVNSAAASGWTALMNAAWEGRTEIAAALRGARQAGGGGSVR